MESADNPYVKYIKGVIYLVQSSLCNLFEECDMKTVHRLISINDEPSQCLFSRMTFRKGPWLRTDKLISCLSREYGSDITLLHKCLDILHDTGLIQKLKDYKSKANMLSAMNACLSADELKLLLKKISKSSAQVDRSNLLDRIQNIFDKSRDLFGRPLDSVRLIYESMKRQYPSDCDAQPEIIRLEPSVLIVIRRMERLVQISSDSTSYKGSSGLTVRQPLAFNAALLVMFGKVRYPVYEVTSSCSFFDTALQFRQWEAAMELCCACDELEHCGNSSSVVSRESRHNSLTFLQSTLEAFDNINISSSQGVKSYEERATHEKEITTCDGVDKPVASHWFAALFAKYLTPTNDTEGDQQEVNLGLRLSLVAAICLMALLRNSTLDASVKDLSESSELTDVTRDDLEDDVDDEAQGQPHAGSVLVSIISRGIKALGQRRSVFCYSISVRLLRLLLSCPYSSRRRARWLIRLCIDLRHLDRIDEAIDEARRGREAALTSGNLHVAALLDRRILFLESRNTPTRKPKKSSQIPPVPSLMDLIREVIRQDIAEREAPDAATNTLNDHDIEVLWSCTACTLLNGQSLMKCEACGMMRAKPREKVMRDNLSIPSSVMTTVTDGDQVLRSLLKQDKCHTVDDGDADDVIGSEITDGEPLAVVDLVGAEASLPLNKDNIWDLLHLQRDVPFTPTVLYITARRLGSGKAGKSRFISYTDEIVSVEHLVMDAMFRGDLAESDVLDIEAGALSASHCPSSGSSGDRCEKLWRDGGWYGWHCEGSPIRSLFGLLMWDVIFMTVIGVDSLDAELDKTASSQPVKRPVFITPYQDAPLDLGVPRVFYTRRKPAIEKRLSVIAALTPSEIVVEVGNSYRTHYRQRCRGVHWTYPLHCLQAMALCLGGKALAGLCRIFCVNYSYFSGGAPDLLMIRAMPRKFEEADVNMLEPEHAEIEVNSLDIPTWLGAHWEIFGKGRQMISDFDDLLLPRSASKRGSKRETKNGSGQFSSFSKSDTLPGDSQTTSSAEGIDDGIDNDDLDEMVADDVSRNMVTVQRVDPFLCETEDLQLPPPISIEYQWRFEACFVEVKGPTDSLAPRQVLWLQLLSEYGINAVVCSVVEPGMSTADADGDGSAPSKGTSGKKRKRSPYVRMYE